MRPNKVGCEVFHLELHTTDGADASELLATLFGWRAGIERAAGFRTLGLGRRIGGGIVECGGPPSWIPYMCVADLDAAIEGALTAGASVLLPPREGGGGRRSVLDARAAGVLGLFQPTARWR